MMQFLLFLHSFFRWLVLISLVYSICRSFAGYKRHAVFSKADNAWRHWTATLAHIQLMLGMLVYVKSDAVKNFLSNRASLEKINEPVFFGTIHITVMLAAIVCITIGSAKAKRRSVHRQKFKTILTWYLIALVLIFLAIPWPFSPFVQREYFRSF